ncbi:MAG: hypothetical protein R3350_04335, partial [Saprospiraceae bacterium]|nr:hypothetical protein [Saprospiraceae bacterium]
LTGQPMIPVLIEGDTSDLLMAVIQRLRQMVGHEETEKDLILSLLRHKRLLVIVDGLSERTAATQRHIEAIHSHLPVNVLIVTARRLPNFGPIEVTALGPAQLELTPLLYFLTEYLRCTGMSWFFSPHDRLLLGDRLLSVVEGGGGNLRVTPLLIRLFVDNAVTAIKQGQEPSEMPFSIPEAIVAYLKNVNPSDCATPGFVPDERMIPAAKTLARCSLEVRYIPRDFREEAAQEVLEREGFDTEEACSVIDRLIANGILEARASGATALLRFRLGPLAEYLAAMSWIDQLNGDRCRWANWLEQLQKQETYPEAMNGFLLALENCVRTYQDDLGIPDMAFPWVDLEAAETKS